ncbi:MAG TPA: NTP transferase domain-containing protein [Pseudomonadota bacterium]|nr:NTP transferase domain-containing protein [Pseudomonadota bacterium]
MPKPPNILRGVVIPAAGLGTRLRPLSLGCPKELLPLGDYPALTACLLEAEAAGLAPVALVSSPEKPGLALLHRSLTALSEISTDAGHTPQSRYLADLWRRLGLRLIEQPQPLGVLDAVERGIGALPPPPSLTDRPQTAVAVLFPDLLHLPDQTALAGLVAAYQQTGQAVFGLRRAEPAGPQGSTLAVQLAPPFDELAPAAIPTGTPLPIRALRPSTGQPNELLTTFGQIQTPAWDAALARFCRDAATGTLRDGGFLAALNALASDGGLCGTLLPGTVLDLGSLPGYAAAVHHFSVAGARLRRLP